MLVMAMLFYGIGVGTLAPMNALYLQHDVGLAKEEIAAIFAVSLLLNMMLTIGVGWMSDRFARKKPVPVMASIVCAFGLFVYMNATGFMTALAGMALATAPSGMIMGHLFAMARKHFTRFAAGIVEISLLWLRATYSIGFFTGLLLGANLYLLASYQGVLWGNLLGYALLFFMLFIYREVTVSGAGTGDVAGEPVSIAMLAAILLLSCADAIRGLYLPLVVQQLFGKPELMSYLWSTQAVFELFFMTVTGYWAAKYGSKRIIFISSLFALATYLVYLSGANLLLFFLVQPVYSFFVSVLYGVAMGYVQRMFIHRTGFGSSLYVFISQTASLTGYLLPLLIRGISPHIFVIPVCLIVLAAGLIGTEYFRGQGNIRRNRKATNSIAKP